MFFSVIGMAGVFLEEILVLLTTSILVYRYFDQFIWNLTGFKVDGACAQRSMRSHCGSIWLLFLFSKLKSTIRTLGRLLEPWVDALNVEHMITN